MHRISGSIQVDRPVAATHEAWARFEELPRFAVHAVEASVRWRAEVLTFEPTGDGTRVTLRIDHEPGAHEADLSRVVEGTLQRFKSFVEAPAAPRRGGALG